MLAEHFHDATIGETCRLRVGFPLEQRCGYLKQRVETIRTRSRRDRRRENSESVLSFIDVAQKYSKLRASTSASHCSRLAAPRRRSRRNLGIARSRRADPHWHEDSRPCGGRRVGASSASSGHERARSRRKALPVCSSHPVFQHRKMSGFVTHSVERNLMRAQRTFHRYPVDEFRSRPTFRRSQNDHRPRGRSVKLSVSRLRFESARICVEQPYLSVPP